MIIERGTIDTKRERDLLSHAIMNTEFLTKIYQAVKVEYFQIKASQTIWKWIAEYYEQYNKAPEQLITDIYIAYKSEVDSESDDIISSILTNLSNNYQPLTNMDYTVKITKDYITEQSIKNLRDILSNGLKNKNMTQCQNAVMEYKKPAILSSAIIRAVSAETDSMVAEAFNEGLELITKLPGAWGELFGDIHRTDCLCLAAYKGIGKTWGMQKIATTAMRAGRKVLWITFEMPTSQMLKRIWSELMAVSTYNGSAPYGLFKEEYDKIIIEWNQMKLTKFEPTIQDITDFRKKFYRYHNGADLYIKSLPSKSVNVQELKHEIDSIALYENFEPDLIVIDYPGLLKFGDKNERRIQLGDTWAELRGWALEKNIAILGAAQINRIGGISASINTSHIGESDDIIAHVTSLVAMMATRQEQDKGLHRLIQLKDRDKRIVANQVLALSCLDKGQIFYDSRYIDDRLVYTLPKEKE